MKWRVRLVFLFVLFPFGSPALAQIPNGLAVAEQVEAEGYFEKCRHGEMRGCSYFARLVALRLNPSGDPNGWGTLTKPAGGSNVEGYADDAIVFGSNPANLHNVIDLVGGAGAAGARVQWGGPHPRRTSDVWEAPRPLTEAQMQYLKPGSSPAPVPSPPPTPPPPAVNLQPVLDAIAALNAKLDSMSADVAGARVSADGAKAAVDGVAATANDTRRRLEEVLIAVDLARQQLANPPSLKGSILGIPVTLHPVR